MPPPPECPSTDAAAFTMRSLLFAPGNRADVLAKLPRTSPSAAAIDLEDAVKKKYEGGCPRCDATPCACG